jgi:hypothetical protein
MLFVAEKGERNPHRSSCGPKGETSVRVQPERCKMNEANFNKDKCRMTLPVTADVIWEAGTRKAIDFAAWELLCNRLKPDKSSCRARQPHDSVACLGRPRFWKGIPRRRTQCRIPDEHTHRGRQVADWTRQRRDDGYDDLNHDNPQRYRELPR